MGIGFFGVAAAKTLQQLNPTKSLVVFDSGSTVGGVWSKDRLYPGLKTNNMLGTFEYPDFPMEPETFGIQPGEHISGEAMNEYLTRYAEKYGIINKIRRKTQVLSAEHQTGDEGGWILSIQNGYTESRVFSRKLVIATGLTSEPFLPRIRGEEKFGAPLFHSKDFPKHSDTIQSSKSVVVFGGTKSAFDVVYAYASQGVKVDWVIRGKIGANRSLFKYTCLTTTCVEESGHGPIWISPPYVTPLRVWLEKLVRKYDHETLTSLCFSF
jgi:Predicted flavoprotein involved in K+ transport